MTDTEIQLDLDDLNIDNAYFKSFDMIVRRMLDPVWHNVGARTKQLVGDLSVLRRMLRYERKLSSMSTVPDAYTRNTSYLLTYDAVAFQSFIDTLIASNTTTDSGTARQNQSPWMLTDAANIIFQYAKRRCYIMTAPTSKPAAQPDVNPYDDEDAWEALYEMEGNVPSTVGRSRPSGPRESPTKRPKWLPDGMEPVLEEQPKLSLLADVLQEIEEEMMRLESRTTSRTPPVLHFGCARLTTHSLPSHPRNEHCADHDLFHTDVRDGERVSGDDGLRRAARLAGAAYDGEEAADVPLVERRAQQA